MRPFFAAVMLLTLPTAALGQMGGGGMPGGGMPGESGGRGGGMRGGGMGGGRMPGGRPRELKPIARKQIDGPVEEMFRAADVDKDGTVTIDELKSVLESQRQTVILERFRAIDTNNDRLIDQREFIAWQKGLGSVALSDEALSEEVGGIVPDSLSPHFGKSEADVALRLAIAPLNTVLLVNANTNYDKGVTLQELLDYERKRFDAADTDKDGELSSQELRALGPRSSAGPGMEGASEGNGPSMPPPSGRLRD